MHPNIDAVPKIVQWWKDNKKFFQVDHMIGMRHHVIQDYIHSVIFKFNESIETHKNLVTPEIYNLISLKSTEMYLALDTLYTVHEAKKKTFYLPLLIGLGYKLEKNFKDVSKGEILYFLGVVSGESIFGKSENIKYMKMAEEKKPENTSKCSWESFEKIHEDENRSFGKVPRYLKNDNSFLKGAPLTLLLFITSDNSLVFLQPCRFDNYFFSQTSPSFFDLLKYAKAVPTENINFTPKTNAYLKNHKGQDLEMAKRQDIFVEQTFYGFPVSPAWGETIRSVQGLSITDPLIIDLRTADIYHIYVAFSRASSKKQILNVIY